MSSQRPKKSIGKKIGGLGRKAVDLSQAEVVETASLFPDGRLPLLVRPTMPGVQLAAWLGNHREQVEGWLLEHGGLLFRGFPVATEAQFEELIRALSGDLLDYTYRSTPRTRVSGNVFTSTEYPAEQHIPMHNEMSYTNSWPLKIWFFCMMPPGEGGETPIADSHRVYERLDPAIRRRFAERGVLYLRNYGDRLDLPWESVFQTSDRSKVESFCRRAGIEIEWKEGNRLRTSQRCQGVARHPKRGDLLWFNQAHLFHVTSLPAEMREALLGTFAPEDLPRNTFYGDGTAIEDSVLDEIRACYGEESVCFSWQRGDVLLLDNMAVAHGRRPFSGERRILAGMAESMEASAPAVRVGSVEA